MNKALIYRPNNRKLIATSFICAVAIHVTAVVFAENKSKPVLVGSTPVGDEVVGVEVPLSPPDTDDSSPPEQAAVPDEEFHDEKVTMPVRPRKKQPVMAIRSTAAGMMAGMHGGSVKALTLYAPKPNYPYEARRSGIIGSGIARLTVNSAAGNVLDARMARTTGSSVLDNATVETLRRWRFKPGVASNVEVPITYELTGVSY